MEKNKNKFYFFIMLFFVSLLLVIFVKKQVTTVIIVNYDDTKCIKDAISGIKDELDQYDLENSRVKYINGNQDTSKYIIKNIKKNDIIVPIGEKAAVNLKNIKCQKVVSNIVDPISIGITDKLQNQKNDVTGVTDKIPLNLYVDLIHKFKSDIKLIDIIYFKNIKSSEVQVKTFRNICKVKSIKLKLIGLNCKNDIKKITSNNYGKRGMIFIPIDDPANNYVREISKSAFKEKIPIIVSDKYALKDGAAVSIGISYYSLGKQVGQYIFRVLNGEKAKDIYFETEKKVIYNYNKQKIKRLGLRFKE